MKKYVLFIVVILTTIQLAHEDLSKHRKIIFPNVPGYFTLKCDLHMHTVFSDGHVWPTVRVWEAERDNLDAIAVTEHIEYQPHKNDIPHENRNRAFEIETEAAKDKDMIIINGSEITRSMPPGHANAIFLSDVNKLIVDDPNEAFIEAKKQDAFVFWNHPHWTAQRKDGVATLTEMHRKLIKDDMLHGIEVVNELTYSDEALQIALDNNLTLIGNSDVHRLIDWVYKVPEGGHRPVTLVFAKEKTKESIKEGLFNRRTVVNFNNLLIGRNEYLLPLLQSSITFEGAKYIGDTNILEVTLKNNTSIEFSLKNESPFTLHTRTDLVTIAPLEEIVLEVKTIAKMSNIQFTFEVLNAVNAPNSHPDLKIDILVD